jgi:hypothetical protein
MVMNFSCACRAKASMDSSTISSLNDGAARKGQFVFFNAAEVKEVFHGQVEILQIAHHRGHCFLLRLVYFPQVSVAHRAGVEHDGGEDALEFMRNHSDKVKVSGVKDAELIVGAFQR